MNRKIYIDSLNKNKENDLNELLFDVYVRKRWYYIGNNTDNSLYFYERYQDIDSSICFVCDKELCKKDKIFYISNLTKDKAVGKCCIEKIYGYNTYSSNMRRLSYINKKKLKVE